MFGLKNQERELYERIILILADQVDWHRQAAGLPGMGVPIAPDRERPPATAPEWLSEDEEVIAWQQEQGVLDLSDAQLALQQIGAMNADVSSYVE